MSGVGAQEVMLRRLKREVMAQLPPKRRQVVRLPPPAGTRTATGLIHHHTSKVHRCHFEGLLSYTESSRCTDCMDAAVTKQRDAVILCGI